MPPGSRGAPMSQPSPQVIRFSTFELALDTGELRKAGIRIALQEHSRRVLLRLLERPGALVTREELRASLWPSDTFVDFEHGLNTAIKRLRDALGDSAGTPRFIETLPRRGYRFIGAIESPQAASADEQPKPSRTSHVHWMPIGLGTALLVSTVVMILAVVPVRRPAPSDAAMTHLNVVVTPAEQLLTSDALELPISHGRPTRTAFALSPDGRLLAFTGRRGDQLHLYLRPFDTGDAIEVRGTDGAGSPFFSPDGAWIGFWADGKIKKVRADGGPIMDVCATSPTGSDQKASSDRSLHGEIVGASWGSDDTIVFALPLGGLWQVAARGGVPPRSRRFAPARCPTGCHTCFPADTACSSPPSGGPSTGTARALTCSSPRLASAKNSSRWLLTLATSNPGIWSMHATACCSLSDSMRRASRSVALLSVSSTMSCMRFGRAARTGTLAPLRSPFPYRDARLCPRRSLSGCQKPAHVGGPPGTRVSRRITATPVPCAASVARRQADRVMSPSQSAIRRVGRRAAGRTELAHDVWRAERIFHLDARRKPSHHFEVVGGANEPVLGPTRRRDTRARDPGVGPTAANTCRLDAGRQYARLRARHPG